MMQFLWAGTYIIVRWCAGEHGVESAWNNNSKYTTYTNALMHYTQALIIAIWLTHLHCLRICRIFTVEHWNHSRFAFYVLLWLLDMDRSPFSLHIIFDDALSLVVVPSKCEQLKKLSKCTYARRLNLCHRKYILCENHLISYDWGIKNDCFVLSRTRAATTRNPNEVINACEIDWRCTTTQWTACCSLLWLKSACCLAAKRKHPAA